MRPEERVRCVSAGSDPALRPGRSPEAARHSAPGLARSRAAVRRARAWGDARPSELPLPGRAGRRASAPGVAAGRAELSTVGIEQTFRSCAASRRPCTSRCSRRNGPLLWQHRPVVRAEGRYDAIAAPRPGRRQLRGSGSPRAPGWWRDPGRAAARSRAPWRWARERRRAGKSKLLSSSSVTCLSSRTPTGGRARRRSRGDGSSLSGGNARCREARPRGTPVPPGRRARRARVPLPREC